MSDVRPIGIFDSGVGGLSVLREIRRELPHEDLFYAADSKHAPYGDKPAAFIEQRAIAMAEFLEAQGVKALVVACNTATSVAVDALRARSSMPIVAIEPAIKPAVSLTKTGIVGVLATSQTIAGRKFASLLDAFGKNVEILTQACPGLVEQVERGELDSDDTRSLVERYVAPLLARGADTLVLGCTHFPLLIDTIRAVAGSEVTLVDPAQAVSRELRRRLEAGGLCTTGAHDGRLRLWCSGPPDPLRKVVAQLRFVDAAVQPM